MKKIILLISFLGSYTLINAQQARQCYCCKVVVEASFPGSWELYLQNNFRGEEVRCRMPRHDTVYTQTAEVRFIIGKTGDITEVKCFNNNSVNIALVNEAIRIIKESPRWVPGVQNGRPVNTYKKEKISITVSPQYF
jgi:protein TonB